MAEAVALVAVVLQAIGKTKFMLTESQKKEISELITQVEKNTGSEIVPAIVPSSDDYQIVWWKALALFTLTGLISFVICHIFYAQQFWFAFAVTSVYIVSGTLISIFIPTVKRVLIGPAYMQTRVERRALITFLNEEVFKTKNRIGILIFISSFERRVEIIGDTGINSNVTPEDWLNIASNFSSDYKKDPFTAIKSSIAACEILLLEKGFTADANDVNELSNEVR